MKKVFIKKLNHLIELQESIFQLLIEDPEIFRELVFSIDDNIIFSVDNKEVLTSKYMLKIENPYHMEINDKKIINSLYKKLSNQLSDEQRKELANIEQLLFNFLDEICMSTENNLTYNADLDLQKLFSLFQLSYQEYEKNSYLEFILTYIKVCIETYGTQLIVTYNFLQLFTSDEIEMLRKELMLYDVVLLDLSIGNIQKNIRYITIDNEWCIV